MLIVSIEEIKAMRLRRQEINNTPLNQIQWTIDGKVQPITEEEISSWEFMGLSNIDFSIEKFIESHIIQIFAKK
jgi:hypothetical protein